MKVNFHLLKTILISLVGFFYLIPDLGSQVPFECEGQFFLSLNVGGSSKLSLVHTDPSTGEITFETLSQDVGNRINAMGYRSTDNLIYAVHPTDYRLFRIDATGTMEYLTTLDLNPSHTFLSGDISPDGQTMVLIGSRGGIAAGFDVEIVRIDLNDPDYNLNSTLLDGPLIRMLDIAIDPIEGDLYGYDSRNNRVIIMNQNNGNILSDFPFVAGVSNVGSIFFDAFGNLYGYGNSGDGISQNTLFKINKETGELLQIAKGPDGQGTDGCSCPYTVEISKDVNPKTSFACSEVTYTFTIVNSSGFVQSGVDLEDNFPPGFTISQIDYNAYGGNVVSGLGQDVLYIQGMDIHPGIDSVVVSVRFDDIPRGLYNNQAKLMNLPDNLGGFKYSDNPNTLFIGDSTSLEIKKFSSSHFQIDTIKCEGEKILLDASNYGTSFVWNSGESSSKIEVTDERIYIAEVQSGCDLIDLEYNVKDAKLDLHFEQDLYQIELGESIYLVLDFNETFGYVDLEWEDPLENSLACLVCRSTNALPLFDVTYFVKAQNDFGCFDSTTVEVKIDKRRKIYIPNAFSPNNDGINDYFNVEGKGYALIRQFNIYDRWGNRVYNYQLGLLNDKDLSWDGMIQGKKSNPGIYTYFIQVEFLDNHIVNYTGAVLLSE